MRRHEPMSLGDIMKQFLNPADLDEKANEGRLMSYWPELVGPYINAQTERMWIRDRKLHIIIKSAPLLNELMMQRSHLVARLNEITGIDVITDIAFL